MSYRVTVRSVKSYVKPQMTRTDTATFTVYAADVIEAGRKARNKAAEWMGGEWVSVFVEKE